MFQILRSTTSRKSLTGNTGKDNGIEPHFAALFFAASDFITKFESTDTPNGWGVNFTL